MVPSAFFQLYHGIDILRDYLPGFEVSHKPVHSFQQIMTLCDQTEEFRGMKEDFIKMILFDALIGNTDRHTENWAFLVTLYREPGIRKVPTPAPRKKWDLILPSFMKKAIENDMDERTEAKFIRKVSFSPVYDSGSCLARELSEARVEELLADQKQIGSYLDRSKHEIRWNEKKINCFELVRNILDIERDIVQDAAKSMFANLTTETLRRIVNEIDNSVVGNVKETYLSLSRKSLIQALLIARSDRLKHCLSAS